MAYSIKEVSEMTHLTSYTVRYYDQKGLLPFVTRDANGVRQFEQRDVEMLRVICCLKNTGMQIKEIKEFLECCISGNDEGAIQLLQDHREQVKKRIDELQSGLQTIEWKIEHYHEWCK
jgi:DNA-binding transcriptional MerR regulator